MSLLLAMLLATTLEGRATALCDSSMLACESSCELRFIEERRMDAYMRCMRGCADERTRCVAEVNAAS